jgi:hypothetical protein
MGNIVQQQSMDLFEATQPVSLSLGKLAPGSYQIELLSSNGSRSATTILMKE